MTNSQRRAANSQSILNVTRYFARLFLRVSIDGERRTAKRGEVSLVLSISINELYEYNNYKSKAW